MATKEELINLRQRLPDSVIMESLYDEDADFRYRVDQYRTKLPEASEFMKAKFPTAVLNKHYLGAFEPNPQKQTTAHKIAKQLIPKQEVQPKQEEGSFIGETASNLIPSGIQFGKDIGTAAVNVFNPDMQQNTLANLGKAAVGGLANLAEVVTGNEELFNLQSEEVASAIGDFYVERYGGIDKAAETLKTDPVGFLADVAGLMAGAGGLARGAAAGATRGATTVSRTGVAATAAKAGGQAIKIARKIDPISFSARRAKNVLDGVKSTGNFVVSNVTGLNPQTIATIVRQPSKFANLDDAGRVKLGSKVSKVIDDLADEVSETGKNYDGIRKSTDKATVDKSLFRRVLEKEGLIFDENGKLVTKGFETSQFGTDEFSRLQEFLDDVDVLPDEISANEVLNMRSRLSKMSRFEKTGVKSTDLERVSKSMRKALNEDVRPQIAGLEELDNSFTPIREQFDSLRREFIDPRTGELRDSALSKIANIQGRGKEQALARLKKVIPDIEEQASIVKAIEDITDSTGTKVGTYVRSGLFVAGAVNPSLIMGAILGNPKVAIPLLKMYGKTKNISSASINGIIKKLGKGEKLTPRQSRIFEDMIRDMDTTIKESIAVPERAQ